MTWIFGGVRRCVERGNVSCPWRSCFPQRERMSGMRWRGMSMPTSSIATGRFTSFRSSVTVCSTCRRGFISRKKNSPSRYRYSTVPTPTYPTAFASDAAASSMRANVSGSATTGGPSSMIFWWRRWMEQSRPLSVQTCPCWSARTCTSRWRPPANMSIRNTGEPTTSACTCMSASGRSSRFATKRMPFPPPPSDALTMSG
mmetsp:Transcript_7067/g.17020  ORF Transcript_7067/g.17020 Transcript_7067/m.17020 type:complete len:200 (+) Transcript_7067:450-1049(+)